MRRVIKLTDELGGVGYDKGTIEARRCDMVSLAEVENQLKQIGVTIRFWGKAEMRELQHILIPGEQIKACMNGRYAGGFAMLCATDQRLLLIDKKPMYLTIEDIRYDMVVEVDFGYRLLDASVTVCTPNKTLSFTTFRQAELRTLTNFVQKRVMEIRQQHMLQAVQMQQEAPQSVDARGFTPLAAPAPLLDTTGGSMRAMGAANPYTAAPLRTSHRVSRFGRFLIR